MRCNNICGVFVASAATVISLISVRASFASSFRPNLLAYHPTFAVRSVSSMGTKSSSALNASSSLDYCKTEINSNDVSYWSVFFLLKCYLQVALDEF